ncbi:MAG: UDP-N-acetylglucosamine--N-acetylmuramyl-(pentapeptide) pyrophosphoryl-undecaprenol N-acetylglucosamine transferase [Patescibacteria group bacterium]
MANLPIVLTGGHAGTAGIAVLTELRKLEKLGNAEYFWIGSKVAMEGKSSPTLESRVLPKLGVTFYPITSGKLQTKFTVHTISSMLKIPVGFIQAFFALVKIKPKVILSFGGFTSFPVVFWGKVFGIPVIIHEQTVAIGRAFAASVPFATKILLARDESKKYIAGRNAEVVGNPLMPEILSIKQKTWMPRFPTLLVIGGSRGSSFLNELMRAIVKDLLTLVNIIHLTGEEDYKSQSIFRESLDVNLRNKYALYPNVDSDKMGNLYQNVDIVIARSGANTVSELIYAKIPTIFIPLPRTYLDEQVKNAKYAENYGLGVALAENEATDSRLIAEIKNLIKNRNKIYKNLKGKISPDVDASKKIAAIVSVYC